MMSSAAGLWKLFRDQAERGSGIGLKLFGFIAESVFTIIPESCSDSSRNTVRNRPGIAFTFARIPQRAPQCRRAFEIFFMPRLNRLNSGFARNCSFVGVGRVPVSA